MFDRTLAAVGYDVSLTPQQDLNLDSLGGLRKITGAACITAALTRRLGTPPGGYSRLVRDAEDYSEVDPEYQNPIYLYLSNPTSDFENGDLITTVETAAQQDGRVTVLGIQNVRINPLASEVAFDLIYQIQPNEILETQMRLPT
jgi:hypothetical protein